MADVRVLVLRSPGTNCDEETAYAFERAGGRPERIHIHRLLENPKILGKHQILVAPGGFSYGDDVAAGRILAVLLKTRMRDELFAFRDSGGLVLGVCNGFQVLLQTGLLVEPDVEGRATATLTLNQHGRFEARWVYLAMTPGRCVFVKSEEILAMPIAHAEGRFIVRRPELLDEWSKDRRIVARYVDANGRPGGFPINPNGAMGDVAGICDSTGRVFALMPHPERHIVPEQHPRWTRRTMQPAEGDGLRIFRNAVEYFQ